MLRKSVLWLLVLALAVSAAGCHAKNANGDSDEGRIRVYATFYPLYDFTVKIGGDRVYVENLMPAGVEPHDWEPGPQVIKSLHDADLLVYNGLGFDTWVESIRKSLAGESVTFLCASEGIEPLHGNGRPDHEDEHYGDHVYDVPDPHVWLDPYLALLQAENICRALAGLDPEGAEIYEANLEKFRRDIEQLDSAYADALANVPRREFIVTHRSFAYLARRYNLVQVSITGLSPHNEPTAKDLKDLVDFLQEHEIGYILREPFSGGRLEEALARDTGARIMTIHPLACLSEEELSAGKDYFSIMLENLETLKTALGE